jgi:hypothetical protein
MRLLLIIILLAGSLAAQCTRSPSVFDSRSATVVSWLGAVTDTVEAGPLLENCSYSWGDYTVGTVTCSGANCRVAITFPIGLQWFRINGGTAYKAIAYSTITNVYGSPWSADFSSDFGG